LLPRFIVSQTLFCTSDTQVQAPHHSKASWMKYWRRHKHELSGGDGHQELPILPEKKKRYSRADDILLARYFLNKPRGTSDHIFQEFSRMVRIHPHTTKDPFTLTCTGYLAPASPVEGLAGASSDSQGGCRHAYSSD
jgi:hypothetical protein